MKLAGLQGAPFDLILDVGGNIGETAEAFAACWPDAKLVSFEPLPGAAEANRLRSRGRWDVVTTAISDVRSDDELLYFCTNQHPASTMQAPGTARRRHFRIDDLYEPVSVQTQPLDAFLRLADGRERVLIKVDVEGHEAHVLRGAERFLSLATTVVCEVQQDATIFLGSPAPYEIDAVMRGHGLYFDGLAGAFLSPTEDVLQWDGIWTRDVVAIARASDRKQA